MKQITNLLAIFMILAFLTGCVVQPPADEPVEEVAASESADADESSDATSDESSADMDVDVSALIPEVQIEGFPAFEPSKPLLEVVSRDDETVMVLHSYGETEIPANPQRIFVNDMATMQILLSLGIEPAGVASFLDELPAALQGNADGVELLMDVGEGISLTPPCGSTASVA